ncbi:MAG TPA: radical SAM protein [Burkholderiales bacterium]|jgi:MoaA/NifB/PqqE/SkfB family radical SAM enzyme|nr:radical SAM protein [Burkholderiales bacterium]
MRLRVLATIIRNALVRLEIGANRLLGRQFIPDGAATFHIETSGACNLKCRFCAYEKKSAPKVSMPNELFFDCVAQAVELGYARFDLTPSTGDVFMDRRLFDKLAYLEQHPRVEEYAFFTNLTIPKPETLARLTGLRKLRQLTVSVYGHDLDSFVAITKSTEQLYRRLLANLDALLALKARWPFAVAIGFRSTFDVPRDDTSDLLRMLRRYREAGVPVRPSHGVYNNWGGYITPDDVAGLDMHITSTELTYKFGACVKLFDSVQVMASGVVNACACRDVDASLRIGDARTGRLADILSARNAEYMRIIDEQQQGQFRPVCAGCDFYKSIYHQRSEYRRARLPMQTLERFKARLGRPAQSD